MTTTTPAKPRDHQDVRGCSLKSNTVIGELESIVTGITTEPPEVLQTEICVHYWMIAPAFSSTSNGVCKYCGEKREFENYWDQDDVKERSNFLLNYKRWDIPYGRDRADEFVRGLRQHGSQDY